MLKNIIFIISLTSNILFPVILSIFGGGYVGKEEGGKYIIFCASFWGITFLIFLLRIVLRASQIYSKNNIIWTGIPLLFILSYGLEFPTGDLAVKYFQQFLLWSLPATYIGIYMANSISRTAVIWFWFMVITSIGVVIGIVGPFINGNIFDSLAGASYQEASYTASLSYSLNLFFLLFAHYFALPSFLYKKYVKILFFFLLFLQIMCVFITGGRGGFVVIFCSTSIYFYCKYLFSELNMKKLAVSIILVIIILIGLIPILQSNDVFTHGFSRVFSYISEDGIDMAQTSNRDIVYASTIELIQLKPIFGYGIFKYFETCMYPHNLFLEILLGRGLVYFILFIFIIALFIRKLINLITADRSNLLLLPFAVFSTTSLMVSGTYLTSSFFWFLSGYVFCTKVNSKKVNIK
ncbi:MAG: O-antigen ligase family protein [Anaerovoracaceae bacterium]